MTGNAKVKRNRVNLGRMGRRKKNLHKYSCTMGKHNISDIPPTGKTCTVFLSVFVGSIT